MQRHSGILKPNTSVLLSLLLVFVLGAAGCTAKVKMSVDTTCSTPSAAQTQSSTAEDSDKADTADGCFQMTVSCGKQCRFPGSRCSLANPTLKCTNVSSGGTCACQCK